MPLPEPFDEMWERVRRERRLSDTIECRRAFLAAASWALSIGITAVTHNDPEGLIWANQQANRFNRERC
jgi:hypothetical protein